MNVEQRTELDALIRGAVAIVTSPRQAPDAVRKAAEAWLLRIYGGEKK